jgi:PAS domain S-box-containing protein
MKNGKILVVEDSRIVAEDIKQKLTGLGYTVSAIATSGETALAAAEQTIPDIALMDIQLGKGMNGIDTANELRQKYQVPVIYLTAYADDRTIEKAKFTEPYGYIIKPFDDDELQSAIEIAMYKHQMERKLRISEEWLRTALTSIGDGVIATDMEGCVTFINPVAESLTGWTQKEAVGQPLAEVFTIINEHSGKPCENPVARVIKTGQTIGLANHTLLISKNGREIPIKDSGSPIVLNGRERLGVILVFQDDTENRKAEKAILKSEKKYRDLFEYNPVETITVDAEGKITGYNFARKKSAGRLPDIGDVMYRDYAANHHVDMYSELIDCIRSSKRKHFPQAGYKEQYLDITMAPFPMGAIITAADITDQVATRGALEDSEEKWRSLTSNSGDIIQILDTEGTILYMNRPYPLHTMTDVIGKSIFDFTIDRFAEVTQKKIAWLMAEKKPTFFETAIRLSDDSAIPFEIRFVPILKDGRVESVISMATDISVRKQAEEALRKSVLKNEFLAAIIEKTHQPIGIGYPDGRLGFCNQAFCELTGYTFQELKAMGWAKALTPPEWLPSEMQYLRQLERTGKPVQYEKEYIRKDGSRVPIDMLVHLARNDAGETDYYYAFVTDISERKRSQEEHDRLISAIEQVGDLVVITGVDGVIQYVNPAFVTITGYSKEDALGNTPRLLKSGHHDNGFYDNLWNTILSGKQWTGRIVNKRKDGSLYTGECAVSPVKNQAGDIVNFVWISRDITEKLELELRSQQNQKLESIGALAGGIAHDFNNILSSVIGFTELALDEVEKNTTLEDNLQEVYAAGRRAKDLVGQILAFARQSGEERKPIQVSSIVKEVLKFIRSSTPTTIEIHQQIESDSLIMGDATRLHQVMMNLCTNAAHAMDEMGGEMRIGLRDVSIDGDVPILDAGLKPGDYVEITVSDTGAGIEPEMIGSIFEPYFTTKGPGEGTGMGLAMVHGIVETYEGKITVDSRLNEGSVFTIYLPTTRKRRKHRPYQSGDLPSGTESILFVDDEASIAKMGSEGLERLGYSVTIRTSSVEALELFKSRPEAFDLVITDMTMPNMTGDKLAMELLNIRSDIPVILCTGYSKKVSDETIAEIGIKAFAYKPVVKADLAKTVREVLDKTRGSTAAIVFRRHPKRDDNGESK